MSDTPETDNLARGNHVVPTEFARDLERERDELRRERDEALVLAGGASTLRELANLHVEALLCWSTAERERDEARQQERIHYDNFLSMQDERDQWRECAELLVVALKELGGGDLPDYAEFVLSSYHKLREATK
jgi:hypothetical protein